MKQLPHSRLIDNENKYLINFLNEFRFHIKVQKSNLKIATGGVL